MKNISFIINFCIKLSVNDIDIKIEEMSVVIVSISFILSKFNSINFFIIHTEVVFIESQYIIQISKSIIKLLYQMLFRWVFADFSHQL